MSLMMEDAEQIVKDAKNILPFCKYFSFVIEFRELLRRPLVPDWHGRSLRIFDSILQYDSLTRRLFRFFQSEGGRYNFNIVFLESAYLHLDDITFRHFYSKMLQFVVSRSKKKIYWQVVGNYLLEIVRERENQHRRECQTLDIIFPFRFYQSFQFLFEMYLKLDLSTYERLLHMIYEHKSRGKPNNEDEIERLRKKALELFKSNEYLTYKLLNFCTRGKVTFSASTTGNLTSDSMIPVEQNHRVSEIRTPSNPTTDSRCTEVGQALRIPEFSFSPFQVGHNHPVQSASNLNNPSTVPVGKDLPDLSTPDNPQPYSATSVGYGQNYPVQGIRFPEHPTPVSAVPVGYNDPFSDASTLDFLNGKNYPVLDLCPGFQPLAPVTPVEPCNLELNPKTSMHLNKVRSIFALLHFKSSTTGLGIKDTWTKKRRTTKGHNCLFV